MLFKDLPTAKTKLQRFLQLADSEALDDTVIILLHFAATSIRPLSPTWETQSWTCFPNPIGRTGAARFPYRVDHRLRRGHGQTP